MKSIVGLILMFGGMALMVGGLGWAVWQFAQLYQAGLDNGMAEGPDPKQTSSSMLTAVGIGVGGFIPMTIGSAMLGNGLLRRLKMRLQGAPRP